MLDPICVEINGDKCWLLDNKLHREDGPAMEYANGDVTYWVHGKLHREDGPAIILANGKEWYWLLGERVTAEEHEVRTA